MRKIFRAIARTGHDHDVWPVVLLLFAVLVPAICLLWFMAAAMRNERLASRQKLADVYRAHLLSAQARLEQHWNAKEAELGELSRGVPAPVAFARCVQSGIVDSVIIRDESGRVLYPNVPTVLQSQPSELEFKWADAGQLEYLRKDVAAAADRYGALAKEATNVDVAARAWQCRLDEPMKPFAL